MAEVTYTLTPAAEAAIVEERARLVKLRKTGLVRSSWVVEQYTAFIARMMRIARQDQNAETKMIGVQCRACKRQHMMPASITTYFCQCSPKHERFSFRDRVELS